MFARKILRSFARHRHGLVCEKRAIRKNHVSAEDPKDATEMASDGYGLKSEFITRGINATHDEFIDLVELNCLR